MAHDYGDGKDVRVMKASRQLQAKVGTGTIDEKKISKSQRVMNNLAVDFAPLAQEYLTQLEAACASADKTLKDGGDTDAAVQQMIEPLMQLKGNASMFDFELVGKLAAVVLEVMEAAKKLDRDVVDVMRVLCKMLQLIITNGMKGDGGQYGVQLEAELREACRRYYSKNNLSAPVVADVFFID